MTFEVDVRGVREVKAALEDVKGKVDPALGKALGAAAEPVKTDVKSRAAGYGAATVSGVRIRRRGKSVRVEQGARKTTGRHPSFGAFQQRNFFDPALEENQVEVIALLRVAIDQFIERSD